ncbi:MAG TPA: ATP-binding cassette domain-containing protein [Gaiellaceae bacterium]|nr:ATP-binding cassette domain-containing protein [Gaiellaceae bacterium]
MAQVAEISELEAGAPIRTVGLSKVYRGRSGAIKAVDALDLEIARGEFFGLLGPNGAGKSTTIGMLTTMVVPTAGHAYIEGIDVERHPAAAKRRLGFVSQTNTLDRQLTVRENLYYHGRFFGVSRSEAERRSDDLLKRFSLSERADSMVFELSGGLAQRLMIARALVHRPEILFLDEPTSGIDPQTRINLWGILRDLHASGQTILLTTHYMEEADSLCERIAILDQGRMLALGSPAELKADYGAETVIVVTVDGEGSRLLEEAERLDNVLRAEADGSAVRVFANPPEGVLVALIERAHAVGLEVRDASSQPPSLETVFLSLTGREYRE